MIAGLLAAQGLSVGTYTSPHVGRLNERIANDGSPVEDDELAEAISCVAWAAQRTGVAPSWFEALAAAGLWLLAARHTEVAVIEVGMLGRWDATNVVDRTVAVLTNVQLDHTEMAGPTRAAIAAEKAGIIKPGATLVLVEEDPDLRPIFEAQNPGRILTEGARDQVLPLNDRHAGWPERPRVAPRHGGAARIRVHGRGLTASTSSKRCCQRERNSTSSGLAQWPIRRFHPHRLDAHSNAGHLQRSGTEALPGVAAAALP